MWYMQQFYRESLVKSWIWFFSGGGWMSRRRKWTGEEMRLPPENLEKSSPGAVLEVGAGRYLWPLLHKWPELDGLGCADGGFRGVFENSQNLANAPEIVNKRESATLPRLKNCIKMVRQSAACCVGCCCVLASLGGVLSLLCGIALLLALAVCVYSFCVRFAIFLAALILYIPIERYIHIIYTHIL